ncbi:hypothetical protein OIV83_005255 [Microbotryomycetes sp. JL201]|nr:hypothetical protein OIV83_005255 [Microbotryomycetes sp. JL201]
MEGLRASPGVSSEQDRRFKDKEALAIKKGVFPPSFDTKVDMRKVELAVMKPWIAKKVVELLEFEDEVLIEYINSLLEDTDNPIVDAKKMQHALTGFLHKKTPIFMQQLWDLLLSAQSNPLRVPTELLEEKKKEMRARAEAEAANKRAEQVQNERMAAIRQRERGERDGNFQGGFGGSGRGGGRGGASYDRGERGGYRGRGGYGGGRDGPPPRRYDDYAYDRRGGGRPRHDYDDHRRDDYRDRPGRNDSRSPSPPSRRQHRDSSRDNHSPRDSGRRDGSRERQQRDRLPPSPRRPREADQSDNTSLKDREHELKQKLMIKGAAAAQTSE